METPKKKALAKAKKVIGNEIKGKYSSRMKPHQNLEELRAVKTREVFKKK